MLNNEPLAEFLGYYTGGKFGVDGIMHLDIKVMNEEKYNAMPLIDYGAQMLRIVVYAPFGEGPENNTEARKAALGRILAGLGTHGKMGDGSGAKDNRLKEGDREDERVDQGLVNSGKRRTTRQRGNE